MQNLEHQLQLTIKECERLKHENRLLKELLKSHNIEFRLEDSYPISTIDKTTKVEKLKERIHIFKKLFKGRTDVFALRWESKNGKSGYSPACKNEWHPTLCQKPIVKKKVVIPDISIICEKEGFTENNYHGVPTMIIEILSFSNQSHDLVTKLNLYMKYGVKEYWIVNPILNTVIVYILDEYGGYEQKAIVKETGLIHSSILQGFYVKVDHLFN
ncbi:Uma2 family endonuclease [Bacillus sp. 03113]|uniref:Uma2 family endonuclease n=1 Tax=Bacillus sp. 03113 TaxID=2578211 RepID=UPI0011416020|nr:Uma2 family endonuclease [Bacillus sp. 03113]